MVAADLPDRAQRGLDPRRFLLGKSAWPNCLDEIGQWRGFDRRPVRRRSLAQALPAPAGAGDVPFGETKAARTSLGVGLLLAIPPQSRRMVRADIAFPITSGAPNSYVFRVTVTSAGRVFWREPGDIGRVRAGAAATSIFGWP